MLNLKENYERYFGKMAQPGPSVKTPLKNLSETDVQKWQQVQKLINNQFPGTNVSVLGTNVYINNRLVETSSEFFKRSVGGMVQTLKATKQKWD